MAARDKIHGAVKAALIKDGWTITDDPFIIAYKGLGLSADLGAERVLAAEQGSKRIVVEVKSFLGPSPVNDLQKALGQYGMYRYCLKAVGSERLLFMAISTEIYAAFFQTESVTELIADAKVKLLIVNLETEEVTQWIECPGIVN